MTHYNWGEYEVEVDEVATQEWYAQAEKWDCECGHCRNFMALTDQLPAELLSLLDQLKIPAEKAVDVCHLRTQQNSLFLYEIRYRLAGRILSQADSPCQKEGFFSKIRSFFTVQTEKYPHPWHYFRCLDEPAMLCGLYPDAFPQPHFEFCIQIWLPWVLDEPIND